VIVLDASAVVALLVEPSVPTDPLRARLSDVRQAHVPHLLEVEVLHALRRLVLAGRVSPASALRAIRRLAIMPLVRWPHTPLLGRALALRDRFSAYDAVYVALAEALGATLLTRDRRMTRSGGHRAGIELV
jgi:predicted nucleic acid-binding protein